MKQTIISSLFASVLALTISHASCANAQQKNSATGTETPVSAAAAALCVSNLAAAVFHDEGDAGVLDRPGRREAALGGHQSESMGRIICPIPCS
jgi:ABC-type amino acid transport system permease subunit